jgi:hypothetical protein
VQEADKSFPIGKQDHGENSPASKKNGRIRNRGSVVQAEARGQDWVLLKNRKKTS